MAKIRLGAVVTTQGAHNALSGDDMGSAITRHSQGDWGDVDAEDKAANERALVEGARLLSVYHDASGTKFYVITEADRSVTTILLPSEY